MLVELDISTKGKECKEYFLNTICDHCQGNDYYCPSDCDLKEKARLLSDKQWEDLAKKYGDDIYTIAKSIQRRKLL